MDLSTPALLFGSISLMLLAHTNRFAIIAKLIRDLHDRCDVNSSELVKKQIPILRQRLHLIKHMQTLGVSSFLLCTGAMLAIFLEQVFVAKVLFGTSVILLLGSLAVALLEVVISTMALDLVLDDCERPPQPPKAEM